MANDEDPVEINISKIPVAGIGGLGLVIIAGGVVYGVPELHWVGFISLVGGVATGLALLISRHRRVRRTAVVLMVLLAAVLLGAIIVHALA